MKSKLAFTLLFLYSLISNNYAQNLKIGSDIGYGQLLMENTKITFSTLGFSNKGSNYYSRFGIIGAYIPDSAIFSINTGLLYNQVFSDGNNQNLNKIKFIQAPIGVDLKIGKKVFILGGIGCNLNYILVNKNLDDIKYANFQFGFFTRIGIKYELMDKWDIEIAYQYLHDISKLYSEKDVALGDGTVSWDNVTFKSINFNFTVRYKI
jgi:opacity protein-like surface antigen